MNNQKTILGIFGGMGPEATADLYSKIVTLTPAERDQDHIPTLIYSLPQVPERTECIRNNDNSIVSYLIEGVTRLEKAGASMIAIPCNTVHYYFDHIKNAVGIPIIHMIEEVVSEINVKHPDTRKVGLLATAGTLESGLYENELTKSGYQVIVPDEKIENELVMQAVFAIKSGHDRKTSQELLARAGHHLVERGAEAIILGCTEIPLAFNVQSASVPVVDATRVLAERAILMYMNLLEAGS